MNQERICKLVSKVLICRPRTEIRLRRAKIASSHGKKVWTSVIPIQTPKITNFKGRSWDFGYPIRLKFFFLDLSQKNCPKFDLRPGKFWL